MHFATVVQSHSEASMFIWPWPLLQRWVHINEAHQQSNILAEAFFKSHTQKQYNIKIWSEQNYTLNTHFFQEYRCWRAYYFLKISFINLLLAINIQIFSFAFTSLNLEHFYHFLLQVVNLLICLTKAAAKSERKDLILTPFPTIIHPRRPNEMALHDGVRGAKKFEILI